MENETKTIPVTVGALGVMKKGTQKYVTEIQKILLNSTAHILRRTLSF